MAEAPEPPAVPDSVAGWIADPMPFNSRKRGERAQLSDKNSVVRRKNHKACDDGCLVYTARPLPPGSVWTMTLTCKDYDDTNEESRALVSELSHEIMCDSGGEAGKAKGIPALVVVGGLIPA